MDVGMEERPSGLDEGGKKPQVEAEGVAANSKFRGTDEGGDSGGQVEWGGTKVEPLQQSKMTTPAVYFALLAPQLGCATR